MIKKVPMSRIREQYKKIKIDRKWLILALIFGIASFFIKIWPIIFLTLFCIANAILLTIDRYINAPIDIELSTFAAVMMTQVYGLNWGILVAIMTKVAAIFYNRNIRVDHIFMILGYVVAALVAQILPGNIVMVGVIATIIVNLYTLFISKFVTMLSMYEIFTYGISNLIFNIVMFIGFSEFFFTLMSLFR